MAGDPRPRPTIAAGVGLRVCLCGDTLFGMNENPDTETGGSAPGRSSVSRRDLLRYAVGGALLAGGGWTILRVAFPPRLGDSRLGALEALLDVVLPEGELPGHRTTGIMPALVTHLESKRSTRRALGEGLRHLDRRARSVGADGFTELDPAARARLFAACGERPDGSLLRFFYRTVRDEAMQLHYAQPAVWRRVGLPNPPQPDGYPSYSEPPLG